VLSPNRATRPRAARARLFLTVFASFSDVLAAGPRWHSPPGALSGPPTIDCHRGTPADNCQPVTPRPQDQHPQVLMATVASPMLVAGVRNQSPAKAERLTVSARGSRRAFIAEVGLDGHDRGHRGTQRENACPRGWSAPGPGRHRVAVTSAGRWTWRIRMTTPIPARSRYSTSTGAPFVRWPRYAGQRQRLAAGRWRWCAWIWRYRPQPCFGDLADHRDADLHDLAVLSAYYGETCL